MKPCHRWNSFTCTYICHGDTLTSSLHTLKPLRHFGQYKILRQQFVLDKKSLRYFVLDKMSLQYFVTVKMSLQHFAPILSYNNPNAVGFVVRPKRDKKLQRHCVWTKCRYSCTKYHSNILTWPKCRNDILIQTKCCYNILTDLKCCCDNLYRPKCHYNISYFDIDILSWRKFYCDFFVPFWSYNIPKSGDDLFQHPYDKA